MKKFLLACAIIVGSVIFIVFAVSLFEPSAPVQKPDNELFQEYYKEVRGQTKDMDNMLAPLNRAFSQGQTVQAVRIALDIEKPMRSTWLNFCNTSIPPKLQNKELYEQAKKGGEYLAGAYQRKYNVVEELIKYSENPSMRSAALIQKNRDDGNTLLMAGLAALVQTGSQLGLSMEEISGLKVPIK